MAAALKWIVSGAPMDLPSATGCVKACRNADYTAQFRGDPSNLKTGDVISIYALWDDTAYAVFEEVPLFDVNAIIASVGGSLGLFLGFSCRGCLNEVLEWALSRGILGGS